MSKRSRKEIESYINTSNKKSKKDSDETYDEISITNSISDNDSDNDSDSSESEESSLSESMSSLSIDDLYYEDTLQTMQAILKHEKHEDFEVLNKKLTEVVSSINKGKTTLSAILASDMHDYDKKNAVELYGVFSTMEPLSLEYIQLNKLLFHMIHGDSIGSDIPTMNKILTSCTSKEDRLKAFEHYNAFMNVSLSTGGLFSEEWYQMKRKINKLIHSTMSLEMLKDLEKKELLLKSYQSDPNDNMKVKILNLDANINIRKKLYDMYQLLVSSDEHTKNTYKEKLRWYLQLPYNKQIIPNHDNVCTNLYQRLNERMYGLNNVKEQILLHMNNKLNNNQSNSILALNGPPGVGKTQIIKCLGDALGIPFGKINFGGQIDSTLLIGGDSMWSKSSPGALIKILIDAKCSNCIILLDEIDKLTSSVKGIEVQNALLHILDKTQNDKFQDSYLSDFTHNLSNVWFIATMNASDKLDIALKDRLHIINIPSYSKEEMKNIIVKHSLPEMCVECGFQKNDITISENACHYLLNNLKKDIKSTGMRSVERELKSVVSKLSFMKNPDAKQFELSFKIKEVILPFIIDESTMKSLLVKETESKNTYQHMYI
jgi:ATP-dependent Lon protease